jgi:hypothetical protein
VIKTTYDGKGTTQISVKESDRGPLQVLSSKPKGEKS